MAGLVAVAPGHLTRPRVDQLARRAHATGPARGGPARRPAAAVVVARSAGSECGRGGRRPRSGSSAATQLRRGRSRRRPRAPRADAPRAPRRPDHLVDPAAPVRTRSDVASPASGPRHSSSARRPRGLGVPSGPRSCVRGYPAGRCSGLGGTARRSTGSPASSRWRPGRHRDHPPPVPRRAVARRRSAGTVRRAPRQPPSVAHAVGHARGRMRLEQPAEVGRDVRRPPPPARRHQLGQARSPRSSPAASRTPASMAPSMSVSSRSPDHQRPPAAHAAHRLVEQRSLRLAGHHGLDAGEAAAAVSTRTPWPGATPKGVGMVRSVLLATHGSPSRIRTAARMIVAPAHVGPVAGHHARRRRPRPRPAPGRLGPQRLLEPAAPSNATRAPSPNRSTQQPRRRLRRGHHVARARPRRPARAGARRPSSGGREALLVTNASRIPASRAAARCSGAPGTASPPM